MKIIDDLIDELADKNNQLTDILIKTKVLAHRLKNEDLIQWINNELNGYDDGDVVPGYRVLTCQVIGNMSNGFQRAKNYPIPLMSLDEKVQAGMQRMSLAQSISTLDEFIHSENDKMMAHIPPEMYGVLSKDLGSGFHVEYAKREIGKSQVVQAVTSVRSKLLDFLLNLNDEVGNVEDIKPLAEGAAADKVDSMFHSSVFGNNTTVIVGNHNTQTVTNVTQGNFEDLKRLLSENGVANEDVIELEAIIDNDDPDFEKKQYGTKVKAWMSKMLSKAMDGGWKIGLGAAGKLLADGVKMYYGF